MPTIENAVNPGERQANAAAALNCRALGSRGGLPTSAAVEQLLGRLVEIVNSAFVTFPYESGLTRLTLTDVIITRVDASRHLADGTRLSPGHASADAAC